MLFVDDGSTDRTFEMLAEASREDSRIVGIALARNFGHQAAITAALDHVTGDAAVVMDGDLQDVPEAIPQFVEKYRQGFDVVYAQRVRPKSHRRDLQPSLSRSRFCPASCSSSWA